MKSIIITGFGFVFVILGIIAFVFDFMTARNVHDSISEDPYPLQWASVVAAMFCAMGFRMIFRITEQQSAYLSESTEVFVSSYHAMINWWTSLKHRLSHNLEHFGHVLRILH